MKLLPTAIPALAAALLAATALAGPVSAPTAPVLAEAISVPGIPNFHQVSERLFRGGQPESNAWSGLAKLGVTTVVDLRMEREHSLVQEAKDVEAAGMRYVSVPMNGFELPTEENVAKVLKLLDSGETVFVNCKQGRDRTGTVVAAYRIAHEGWACDKALVEAESKGMHWYEYGMKRFIRAYRATPSVVVDEAPAPDTPAEVAVVKSDSTTTPR